MGWMEECNSVETPKDFNKNLWLDLYLAGTPAKHRLKIYLKTALDRGTISAEC